MKVSAGTIVAIEMQAKAYPAEGQTVGELMEMLVALGNRIIKVEDDGIVIAYTQEELH